MKNKCLCMAMFLSLALCFVSCSSHSEGSSFTSRLDSIDAFISQNSTESAIKALKKLEKKAYSSYDRLGIYKRYILLGERKSAERVLVKGLAKLENNPELSAIYVNFLLDEGRLEEAFAVSKCLEETDYSSFYSECVLRKALVALEDSREVLDDAFSSVKKKSSRKNKSAGIDGKKSFDDIKNIFCNEKFIPIYAGAFKGSKDDKWGYNAASVLMKNGEYRKAAELYPQKISNYRNSLFWGCVFFDAGLYAQSLEALQASDRLASLDGTGDYSVDYYAEILALMSDCCYVEGDEEESEELRNKLASIENGRYETPVICMNGAMYAKRHENHVAEYNKFNNLITRYPDYIPGMSGYAQLAIDQLNAPEEDRLSKELRNAGLRTIEMEKRDLVPSVSIEKVLEKISEIENDGNRAELSILKDVLDAENRKAKKKYKSISDIWEMLESCSSGVNYPSEIARYCVATLIEQRMIDEARGLFEGYMKNKYAFEFYSDPSAIDLWECEYAAWFACKNNDLKIGAELYRYIVEHYGHRLPSLNSSSGNRSVINSLVNLGVIYESIDRLNDALEMLSLAGARTSTQKEKAEILYRTAEINWNLGDSRSASRSLKYALSLDKTHNRARVLQKKIKAEK